MPHITQKVLYTSPTSGGYLQLPSREASTEVSEVKQSPVFFTNSNPHPSPVGEKPSAWSSALGAVRTGAAEQINKSFCNNFFSAKLASLFSTYFGMFMLDEEGSSKLKTDEISKLATAAGVGAMLGDQLGLLFQIAGSILTGNFITGAALIVFNSQMMKDFTESALPECMKNSTTTQYVRSAISTIAVYSALGISGLVLPLFWMTAISTGLVAITGSKLSMQQLFNKSA